MGAIVVGLASGVICFWAATSLKRALGYDDSLDAFGVHGIGGIVGALLTGIFAAESLGGQGLSADSIGGQFVVQLIGVVFTIVYCGVLSFICSKSSMPLLACASRKTKKPKDSISRSTMSAATIIKNCQPNQSKERARCVRSFFIPIKSSFVLDNVC